MLVQVRPFLIRIIDDSNMEERHEYSVPPISTSNKNNLDSIDPTKYQFQGKT